jgi:hypothetical protein
MDSDVDARKLATAENLALKGEAVKHCSSNHAGVLLIDSGDGTEAYKMANNWFSANDPLVKEFKDRRELTDMIKSVIDTASNECYECKRQLESD